MKTLHKILLDQELLFLSVASSFPSYRKGLVLCQRSFFSFLLLRSKSVKGMDSTFSSCGKMFFISFVQSPGIPGKGVPGQTSVGCPTGLHAVSVSVGAPLLRVSYVCFAHNRVPVNTLLSLPRITVVSEGGIPIPPAL